MSAPLGVAAQSALEDAAAMRLLAVTFERPRAGWLEEIGALAEELRDPIVVELARGADEGVYHALLGPGGAVSPREVGYRSFEDPGRILAELATLHQAFGYSPRHSEEPIDHLAVEIDFLAYLRMKEAFALANEDADASAVTAQVRQRFLDEHLGPLARGFASRLGEGGPPYLVHAARRLLAQVPAGDAPPLAECDAEDCDGCPGLEQQ